jgi:uncharacterized spore protein YtfJ
MNAEELLRGARDAISVRRVFGEPIEHDGVVIVPAAAVGGGGGGAVTTSRTAAAASACVPGPWAPT